MDSIFDNITSLIKKDLGDPYRLAHIKSRLERNKKLTLSDTNYLNRLLTLSNLRNIENNENPIITTEPIISSEESSEFNYCWNCKTKNPKANAFCTNCESPIDVVKSSIEIHLPKTIPITKKIRKELVILGFIIMIFGIGGFIVPFGDSNGIVKDLDSFCKSGLGLTIQTIFVTQKSTDCNIAFQLLLLADFLVVLGIILIILGLTVKKCFQKENII
ncbi:MAG: hypothetical protein OEL77_04725 [Nitrosopumilus sp.]|nr:hypothetical protein [Nitrosopumilus sp.]MDH3385301.1 hypothetical protein [Nitrosopumilus sp.]